jgi:hypothetical protein
VLRGSQGMNAEVARIDRLRNAELRKAPTGAHYASRGHVLAEPDSCENCGRWHSPEKHAERKRLAQEAFDRADAEDARREAERDRLSREAERRQMVSEDKPRDLQEDREDPDLSKGYKKILRDLLRGNPAHGLRA